MSTDTPALLTGWGRTAPTAATMRRPGTAAGLAAAVAGAGRRGVIARGLGRAYGDPAQNAGGTVIDCTGLTEIDIDPLTGIVRAQAGASLDSIMRRLLPLGWFVPVTPGTRAVTVGGAIAADIHGKNHHIDGTFGRWVRELTLITADGQTRRMAADFSDPVFAATVGGMGLTGVIAEASFQAIPVESSYVTVRTARAQCLDDVLAAMSDDAGYRYSVAWIDLLARGKNVGRGILTHGNHSRLDELEPARQNQARDFNPRTRLSAPRHVPSELLNPLSVRVFNTAWYRKAPAAPAVGIESIGHFFHPLDGVANWNRLYGSQGLMQYQIVVPLDAAEVLREVVDRLAERRLASFLAVLKRFGPASGGYLSFPMAGWTLSVDLPVRTARMGTLFDELDELVVGVGGRVYLAKDAVLLPGRLPQMYPRLDDFRAVRTALDPTGRFVSDMSRRLGI